jgi:hypothetical protein
VFYISIPLFGNCLTYVLGLGDAVIRVGSCLANVNLSTEILPCQQVHPAPVCQGLVRGNRNEQIVQTSKNLALNVIK